MLNEPSRGFSKKHIHPRSCIRIVFSDVVPYSRVVLFCLWRPDEYYPYLAALVRLAANVASTSSFDRPNPACIEVLASSTLLCRNISYIPAIPPRKTATLWEQGQPRNEAVMALREGRLPEWKKDSNYHQCFIVETNFSCYKQLVGSRLSLRDNNAQVGEMFAGVKLLNKLTALGMPVRQPIA